MKKLNVALVGLSFGLEFVAIYCKHPDVDKVFIADRNEKLLTIAQKRYNIPKEQCFTDFEDILKIPEIDAVHLVTPPATHAPFSIQVLRAGKHCGCTIPHGDEYPGAGRRNSCQKGIRKKLHVYGDHHLSA